MPSYLKTAQEMTPSARTERLWKEYLRDPSQWWDNRYTKTNPSAPDFQHRLTKDSLWMDGCHNPRWVHDMLRLEREAMKAREQVNEYNNGGGWEKLSLEEALASLEEGVPASPSVEDFVCILHKCRQERNLAHALCLHSYMQKSGLDAHTSLGNYLVSILAEVGSMTHAQHVFDKLVHRNNCSWNSLITGYVKNGDSQSALTLHHIIMQKQDSLYPNEYTFVALLQACAELKDVQRGCELHAEIARKGLLERNAFVGSSLVDMYAKCGSLGKAQALFNELTVRDVVSWTTLMSAYTEYGHGEEALYCLNQMQDEGVSPDAITFVCGLKACGSIGATDKGQEIHAEIVREGLDRDLFVGNTLIDFYSKCGMLAEAQEVLDKLRVGNVVSWNALIIGCVENGYDEEALECFEHMQLKGISPDDVTLVGSLKACGSIGARDTGQEIHLEVARKGLERDLLIGNTLVDMYGKCCLLTRAQEVFNKLPIRDVVSWNALISGYVEHGQGEQALNCFEQMKHEDFSPDDVTLVCSLKACGSIGTTDKGRELHAEIVRKGLERELFIGNTLVDMYAKCGLLAEAQKMFNKLLVRNIVSWNALITGYTEHGGGEKVLHCFEQMQYEGFSANDITLVCCLKACASIGVTSKGQEIHAEIARKGLERNLLVGNTLVDMYAKCGLLAKAQELFDKLLVRDVISWNALIAGYAEQGGDEKALDCFEQMKHKGISPDVVTFVTSFKACGSKGATYKGQEIHTEIVTKGLEKYPFIGNTLVDMYAKCGSLTEAQKVFDKLPDRSVVSWNALISGYAQLGESGNVFHILDRMIEEGIKPNQVSFISVLNACSHAGVVDKGLMYFEALSKDYGIIPTLQHHTCMVDLLGRAGHVDKAIAMIEKMPFHPGIVMWHTVLGACRKWGNVELGRQAFEHLVRLDSGDAASNACLSNIYAEGL